MSAGPDGGGAPADRAAQLRERLAAVRGRVDAAARAAGRDPGELTLVVVTKHFPAGDVLELVGLGVGDVGENRDQEAAAKAADVAARLGSAAPRWHFVGQLQTNKARSVARYASAVHSVDRARLVGALDRAAQDAQRRLEVFLQVDLAPALGHDADPGRGGAPAADVPALAEAVAAADALRLAGLMAVAPRDADPARAFAVLHELSLALRREHPSATGLSAGMSGDLEQAVAAGATHLRVGSAVLGPRPAPR
ncbi:YggS family pyridoxal phosphate-dependent enzyme [Kineococcus terrestris]|uniref:YggS family pyridoxal phosphate-dependent enzyme n=1 Tax=Kineococcus terrestris TaxID=2044856 RepID=UPI0034DB6E25